MLSNQLIKEMLQDWRCWDAPPPTAQAGVIGLPKALHRDLALILQGVQRCGKLTLMSQLCSFYKLPRQSCYYCNFEDARLNDDLDFNLLNQIVILVRSEISNDEKCYFFFDEIQPVWAWEKWLHMQLERPKNNYFILMSAHLNLLDGTFATALTGRQITLTLFS